MGQIQKKYHKEIEEGTRTFNYEEVKRIKEKAFNEGYKSTREIPHCKIHGAMIKVSIDGMWRCCLSESVLCDPKSTKEERTNHRLKYSCRAGCNFEE